MARRLHHVRILVCLVAALAVVPVFAAADPLYSVQIIDTLDDLFLPMAIDDTEVIVGNTSNGNQGGGYVDAAGVYTNADGYGVSSSARFTDVKNGLAVGTSNDEAVSYSPTNGYTNLDPSTPEYSKAVGINSSGQILIQRGEDFPDGFPETYLNDGGVVSYISSERPIDLNDNGYYVGTDVTGNLGFFDDQSSTSFTAIQFNSVPILPTTINNDNIIGGSVNDEAFLDLDPYSATDGIFLGFLDPAHTVSNVIGMNDGDVLTDLMVTFFSEDGLGNQEFGVWDPIHGAQELVDLLDLNDPDLLGVTTIEFLAVTNPNNEGMIAAAALLDGVHTTLRLSSVVPEANSLVMLGLASLSGALVMLRPRRTRRDGDIPVGTTLYNGAHLPSDSLWHIADDKPRTK